MEVRNGSEADIRSPIGDVRSGRNGHHPSRVAGIPRPYFASAGMKANGSAGSNLLAAFPAKTLRGSPIMISLNAKNGYARNQ